MSKQSTTRLRRRLTESTPPTAVGDYLKRMIKAEAEKQAAINTNASTNGTSATN